MAMLSICGPRSQEYRGSGLGRRGIDAYFVRVTPARDATRLVASLPVAQRSLEEGNWQRLALVNRPRDWAIRSFHEWLPS